MLILRYAVCFLLMFSWAIAEERFLLIDGVSGTPVFQLGSSFEESFSPCSTFKIPLSLMGYDAKILIDEHTPIWDFQEGYDDFLDTWRHPQSPQSWMQYSCVWFSKLISCRLGLAKMQHYLTAFNYGNQDLSGGIVLPGILDPAWFHSSPLKISLRNQVDFISNMLQNKLPVSEHAVAKTKAILFKEALHEGWKLFGKTGWSGAIGRHDNTTLEYAWFVGWVENDNRYFPFAYWVRDKKIQLDRRIPRVKKLLTESGILDRD